MGGLSEDALKQKKTYKKEKSIVDFVLDKKITVSIILQIHFFVNIFLMYYYHEYV